ncbi:BrxA family protein [Wenyingzhuangia marina]|uniref:Putative inner membrane protein n=1 Tax=Wenyingzhuangia marina TaxID=1195760 RepID=A0A1M5S6I4_9FLAO|nr:BrxA family protein [Wenyingzhuangia marina]GGF79121.1 hypothetical protein GCM10011397_22730 [Wenyingzhuangia marina]SHH34242.1 Putative inner membrane protein [Wenyingzhuangia marina]
MNKTIVFDANFTAGGIFFNEFSSLRAYLLHEDFIELLKSDIEENKILSVNTLSARKRIVSEIIRRYKTMPQGFWEFFQNLNTQETKLALFYVCLKTYPIVLDLHFNTTVRMQKLGEFIDDYKIQMRLDELTTTSEEVASWSASTLKKINTQYRKALKDAELLKDKQLIKPYGVSESFWTYFNANNESWFIEACFNN